MGISRLHIAILLLGLLGLMQMPVRYLHLCHEEEVSFSETTQGESLTSYTASCELCELVFPPVLQVPSLAFLPDVEPVSRFEFLHYSSAYSFPFDYPTLRAPPMG